MMANEMNKPTLPLLPDLEGEVTLEEGLGLRKAGPEFLSVLARTMDAAGDAFGADVFSGMRRSIRRVTNRQDEGAWRGLLAVVLLWDTWADTEARLHISEVTPDTPFAAMILAARRPEDQRQGLHLVTLAGAEKKAVLGLLHPTLGLTPAAAPVDLSGLLPDRVTWYDRRQAVFSDPSERLNDRDRAMLIHRLSLLESDAAKRFASALLQEGLRVSRALAAQEEQALEDLSVRAMAVCGLQGFDEWSIRTDEYAENPAENPLLRALGVSPQPLRDVFPLQTTWLWQGKPFARFSSAVGFAPACDAEEALVLDKLAQTCRMLCASVSWQRGAACRLNEWLMQYGQGRGFSTAAREQLTKLQQQMETAARQPQENVVLQWPWPQGSGAAAWLVRELLGEDALRGGSPFSDRMTLLPDAAPDALGDPVLCISCTLPIEATGMPTLALPPLSQEMAQSVAAVPDMLLAESFAMMVTELGLVQASFTLRGKKGDVTFTRLYDEEDIVLLQPEETPTVAVWPSVAFPEDSWKAYHVYTHGHGLTVSALSKAGWVCDDEHMWSVVRTERFPAVLTVRRQGVSLGVLINQLPVFRPERKESVTAAIDFGLSGTAVALRQGERIFPMNLPCLVRTLLHGSQPAPFDKEFLPAEALTGVVPSWAAMFRDTADPLPLVDGHTGGAEQLDFVRTSLKWSVEGPDRKACLLHLRQTMLTASLCAKMNGARDMAWRVTLPADLSPARRASLLEAVRMLAPVVAQETCLPLTVNHSPVCCVDADQAMTAYQRSSGYQRGGFLSMDVGSGGTSMMLWLRGMNRPCAVTHLPLGIHGMLIRALMQQPEAFARDFADMQDAAARQAVEALAEQLRAAHGSRTALNRCMLLLDEMIGHHLPALQQQMDQTVSQGGATLLQSLLLCGFAWLMTTAGLQMERAWQDATVNDHLPQEMPLCLSGRGSLLMTAMPDTLKMRLTRFLRLGMSGDNRVRHVPVVPSEEPKMETALGALRAVEGAEELAADAPAWKELRLPIASLTLLQRFLVTFAAQFPMAAQRLWPDMMTEGQFNQAAEMRLEMLVQMHPEPSPSALALCLEEFGNGNMK